MGNPGSGPPRAIRQWRQPSRLALVAALGLAFTAPQASAQSAADKATAREAATAGIGLYRAGKFADALDKLRRAQALYDAPVHLLYIARSQDKLGQLVEAAENYRLLDRYTLPAGAPEAWTSAVEDGRKELAALEPRIPKLRIVTTPASVDGATLTIDGAAVSAAVVGIERPANPGKHHVAISAPNYAAAEADVALAEAESKDVNLRLVAGTPAVPVVAAGAAPKPAAKETEPEGRSFVGFMAGMRLGIGIPTGTLLHTNVAPARDLSTSDAFGAGGALEIHGGVRLGRYFTPVLYFEGETLASGDGFANQGKVENTRAGAVGIGLMVGTAPTKFGAFGEIDLVLASSFNLTAPGRLTGGGKCDLTAKGGGLRFGGGGVIPISTWVHITPFVMATFGQFTSISKSGDCTVFEGQSNDIASGDQRTHGMIMFGVGGDAILGKDK
jgi:hypothetical protein